MPELPGLLEILAQFCETVVFRPIIGYAEMRLVHACASSGRIEPAPFIERLVIRCHPRDVAKEIPHQRTAASKASGHENRWAARRRNPDRSTPQISVRPNLKPPPGHLARRRDSILYLKHLSQNLANVVDSRNMPHGCKEPLAQTRPNSARSSVLSFSFHIDTLYALPLGLHLTIFTIETTSIHRGRKILTAQPATNQPPQESRPKFRRQTATMRHTKATRASPQSKRTNLN